MKKMGVPILLVLLLLGGCNKPASPPKAPDGMVLVPGGEYSVGSGREREGPIRKVMLEGFFIDRYPVEAEQFRAFVKQSPEAWNAYSGRLAESERSDRTGYPAATMTYDEAETYCASQGKRLPVEYEYEAAARGREFRTFPWGNDWDEKKVDCAAQGPALIGRFPAGAGPSGAEDLVGNVFHWTRSSVRLIGFHAPERDEPTVRVITAGGWACARDFNRTTFRAAMNHGFHSPWVGFRCVKPLDPANDGNLKYETLPEQYSSQTFDASEGLRQLFSYELLPGRSLHPEIAQHIRTVAPGSVVADVGAGIGFLSFVLSKAVGEKGQVWAVDIDKSVLDFVRACDHLGGYKNITTLVSEPADAKLKEGAFDEVYLLGTVHCLSDETWLPFIDSCRRALKPGGLLVVQDNTSYPVVQVVVSKIGATGFKLTEYAGSLLPAESGAADEELPTAISDLRQRPDAGYLFRIYKKE